jgi:hypothetical protein
MLFQLNNVQEIEFLSYLTGIFLGLELVIYMFYRYHKTKDERLPLNKILLSYGMFYSLLILGIFISAINRFFISDAFGKELFYKIGLISILFSSITFLFFIRIEEFSKIINLRIARYIMLIGLISIIIIFFLPVNFTISFIIVSILTIILLSYILVIQIKLIITSKGNIKKRLNLVFIGEVLDIISLSFISESPLGFSQIDFLSTLFFMGIILLISGFIVASLGVYAFPAFYEFKLKENLLKLYIINQDNNYSLFSHDFTDIKQPDAQSDHELLFSGGIIGIDIIISLITDTKNENLNKIKQADSFILLEYGTQFSSNIIYALVVKNDIKSNRYFLKSIKDQFESFYKEMLSELDNITGSKELLFSSFEVLINNIIYSMGG